MGKGRPKGSVNRLTLLAKEIFEEAAEEMIGNLTIMAKVGDPVALRLVMARIYPVRAGAPVEFDMPTVRHADDVPAAYNALLQAVADGQVTPAEAVQITRVLEAQAKVVAFQFGAPWQPDTKSIVERLAKMKEEDAQAAEARQNKAA
jgi:hypothetical protein